MPPFTARATRTAGPICVSLASLTGESQSDLAGDSVWYWPHSPGALHSLTPLKVGGFFCSKCYCGSKSPIGGKLAQRKVNTNG